MMKFFYCTARDTGKGILSAYKTLEEAQNEMKKSMRIVEIMAEKIDDCYHADLNEIDDDYTVLYNSKTHTYTTI